MASRGAARDLPECTAVLLCERIIFNANTAKHSVIEILDVVDVPDIPITVGPVEAYARLIGGVGGYAFRFEIHDLEAGEIAGVTPENIIEFGGAAEVMTLAASFPAFEVTGSGPYDLVLFANGQGLGRFTFHVAPYRDQEGDNGTENTEET